MQAVLTQSQHSMAEGDATFTCVRYHFTSQNWKGRVLGCQCDAISSAVTELCSLSSEAGLRRLASHIPQCWAAWSLCGRHHTWTPTFFKQVKQNLLIDEGSHFLTLLMCFISSAAFCPQCLFVGLAYILVLFFRKKRYFVDQCGFLSLLASQE